MKKKIVALFSTVVMLCTFVSYLVQAQGSFQRVTSMESVLESVVSASNTEKKALENHGATFVAESEYYQFVLPKSTEQPIQILSKDFSYSMTIPMDQTTDTTMSNNSIYMFDKDDQHAVAMEANAYGILQTHIIYGAMAPTSFAFQLNLPEGSYADFTPSSVEGEKAEGSISIYNSDGIIQSGLINPVATDANGNIVDTSYRIKGDEIVFDVEHNKSAVDYPVCVSVQAVSFGFTDFFSSGQWITRDGVKSLSLTRRTDNGSWNSSSGSIGATLIGEMAWETVYNRFRYQSCWYNTNGLKDQFMCHVSWAMNKSPWNLEPSRPDVGYAATVAASCNP